MKRYFFLAAVAALCVVSCTKNDDTQSAKDGAVSFLPANYVATKVTGSVFPTDETFSTYAWTAGTAGEYFINNETVSYYPTGGVDGTPVWKTATTYYWPAGQSVDFFSYYPTGMTGLTVAKNQISYVYDYAANQTDIMYADKAVRYYANANEVEDGASALNGVPTFFRHAGSKVKFNIVAGTMSTLNPTDSTITRWEIDLKEVTLSGIFTRGSAVLNLSDTTAFGIVPWTAPTDTNGYKVWTPDGTVCNPAVDSKFGNYVAHQLWSTGTSVTDVIPEFYVLPQTLLPTQQKVTLKMDIRTYRQPVGVAEFLAVTQTDYVASADLVSTEIPAWQMNHAITYTIVLNPTGSYSPKPIYWDPAVDAWQYDSYNTNINLNL